MVEISGLDKQDMLQEMTHKGMICVVREMSVSAGLGQQGGAVVRGRTYVTRISGIWL